MADAIVQRLELNIFGQTRDSAIDLADNVAMEAFNVIGGAPWLMIDDDTVRVQANNIGTTVLSDPDGYMYHTKRSYIFTGPIRCLPFQTYHDGLKPQKGVEGGEDKI